MLVLKLQGVWRMSVKTEWYSTWQTNDPIHNYRWATEIIEIERTKDHFTFESKCNDLKYSWHGLGEIHKNYYVSGTWQSRENNPSAGSFMLHIANTQDRIRTGFLLGPTEGDRKNFGAWVLVRKDGAVPDRATALDKLEAAKSELAASMCPGLGELVKHSGGQFIEEYLHPAIATAHQLLKSGDPQGAVTAAFSSLEPYVRTKAKNTNPKLNLLDLMITAFKPGKDGPLSNGKDTEKDINESSEQHRMQDLFKGSLYIRNIYQHKPPTTSVSDAVILLMVATYFYRLVDSQAMKRATLENR